MILGTRRLWPGVAVVMLISVAAFSLAGVPAFAGVGLSALTLAILIGAVLGHFGHRALTGPMMQPGLIFAQKALLRVGVALYGLNVSLQQILSVGPAAIVTDLFVVTSTIFVGWWVGYRWLRMDRDTVLLASAGSAICGAVAVVASEPVLGDAPNKTSAAVGQVVLFGTLAMLVYLFLFGVLGVSKGSFGIYIGSTVHEVAQVVAIGKTVGGAAAENAVIVKMIRVMMLAPFLIILGRFTRREAYATKAAAGPALPGFAVAFIAIALIHPYLGLPDRAVSALRVLDVVLLAAAMAALGLETTIAKLRAAGRQALLLGAILFAYLMIGGGVGNWLIQRAFG